MHKIKAVPLPHPPFETHEALAKVPHGFFGREGGISTGDFGTLNCGHRTGDIPENVIENQKRICAALGSDQQKLVFCKQVHSAKVVQVDAPWPYEQRPDADGLVTNKKGITLGVQTADCAPVLFHDAQACVIGAAHAGWKGALGGVLEATLAAMETLGSKKGNITTVIGPCIQQNSYEVGPEFYEAFMQQAANNAAFFMKAPRPGHFLFDLPNYALLRLKTAGVLNSFSLGFDTQSDAKRYFSYRRKTLKNEPANGVQMAVICL